jgi:hypothetical protein
MRHFILVLLSITQISAVEIIVDASSERKPISPYIYGRNNSLSDNSSSPLSQVDWEFYRQAGVRMFREGGGNNSTKYNWRRKLSSHPDWYNNVYRHDWDYAAQSLEENMPGTRGMWSFQLIGYAASNRDNNFNDWEFNGSQWWEGVNNNWAGGGGPEEGEGDPDLYLIPWPPDSTVGILNQWFGDGGLDLDESMFQYWSMDNEVEIWSGTHDDIMPVQISAEALMDIYFEVVEKAREKFPDIKIVGPVPANEWQWYNWNNSKITYQNERYTWLEYFIKRIADEQAASGIRLLDVLDVHFYPYENDPEDIVQLHRVWFDENYNYPGANGVKVSGPGEWDNSITKEYVFKRCRDWMEEHLGTDHGVGLSVSEMGIQSDDPNIVAIWYASTLGIFAGNGVEIFTPWYWKTGMWEVLHLFSRYAHDISVSSVSDLETYVSAYSSINSNLDSMTIILVNRSLSEVRDVTVHMNNFSIGDGAYTSLMLNNLPGNETFESHTNNALEAGIVTVQDDSFTISLPALSITAVILDGTGSPSGLLDHHPESVHLNIENYPNPFNPATRICYEIPLNMDVQIRIVNLNGQEIETLVNGFTSKGNYTLLWDASRYGSGVYFLHMVTEKYIQTRKMLFTR